MIGVFVQVNERSPFAKANPIGYVLQENGCWQWSGGHNADGYGTYTKNGRNVLAHRYTYEQEHGAIPDGLETDHLCRNRGCVNPAHLETVTSRTNTLRGNARAGQNARKTHCKAGHRLTLDNLMPYGLNRGERECRICANLRAKKYRAAKRRRQNVN